MVILLVYIVKGPLLNNTVCKKSEDAMSNRPGAL